MNFFDQYPEFYRESGVKAYPKRLNRRYEALIESNRELIHGKKILDIGSNDGRWSFAAIKNGAKHVVGIEWAPEDVEIAINIMKKYNIPQEKYQFIVGDVFQEIKKIESNTIDTMFCFGFLYNTIYHMEIFDEIKRLNPLNLIIDTEISKDESNVIKIRIGQNRRGTKKLKGAHSRSALELMLTFFGYNFEYYDWQGKNIQDWEHNEDYEDSRRITMIAKRD